MRPRLAVVTAALVLLVAALSAPTQADLPRKHEPHRPVQIVKVVRKRGFSWRDAGIGAAATGLGIAAVAAGGLLLVRTERLRPTK
jgi:hypothetical protein